MARPEISRKETNMLPDQRGEAVYSIQQNIFVALSKNPSYLAALHNQFISPNQARTSALLGASIGFVTPDDQEITVTQKVGVRKTNGQIIATRRMKTTVDGMDENGLPSRDSFSLTARYVVGDKYTLEPSSFLEGEISYMRNGAPVFSGRANDAAVATSIQRLSPILNPEGKEKVLTPEEVALEAFRLQEKLIQITRTFPEDKRDGFGKSFGSHIPTAQEGDHHGSIWLTPSDRVQIDYTLDRMKPSTVDNLAFSRVLLITFSRFSPDLTVENNEAIVVGSVYRLDPITHEVLEYTDGEFTVWNINHDGDAAPKTGQDTIRKVYEILKPVLSVPTA